MKSVLIGQSGYLLRFAALIGGVVLLVGAGAQSLMPREARPLFQPVVIEAADL